MSGHDEQRRVWSLLMDMIEITLQVNPQLAEDVDPEVVKDILGSAAYAKLIEVAAS